MWISVCAYFGGLGGSIVHGVTVVDDIIYKICKSIICIVFSTATVVDEIIYKIYKISRSRRQAGGLWGGEGEMMGGWVDTLPRPAGTPSN